MRDKERLLSLDEPVSFIFAHSALKEGWDNPNVFQICTLTGPVRDREAPGDRPRAAPGGGPDRRAGLDEGVNVLTVVANESYRRMRRACSRSTSLPGTRRRRRRPTRRRSARPRATIRSITAMNTSSASGSSSTAACATGSRWTRETLIAECVNRLDRAPSPAGCCWWNGAASTWDLQGAGGADRAGQGQTHAHDVREDGNPTEQTRFFKPGDDIARVAHEDGCGRWARSPSRVRAATGRCG